MLWGVCTAGAQGDKPLLPLVFLEAAGIVAITIRGESEDIGHLYTSCCVFL